ncbi:hypothetical protein BJ875DRAFT_486825 [Amylocarpus encephaloides]|uniref:Uncharacterized protein n=1 Tax=Amylocarpus encephaloides TaxID=45428 RepID=A0A9P7YDU2_9HELO|nr:hypothetical protein BJ875DRAFT_486825 [Amylocarpus encephaloides]
MKNVYVGFNNKGEKVTAKCHGGHINIEGITVAKVDDKDIGNKKIVKPKEGEDITSQEDGEDDDHGARCEKT